MDKNSDNIEEIETLANPVDVIVMPEFNRENRYIVAKRKDILRYLSASEESELGLLLEKIEHGRDQDSRRPLVCAVIESDWPEYEPTWDAIQKRVELTDQAWSFVENYADGGDSCGDCKYSDQSAEGWVHTCELGDRGCVTDCPALPDHLYPEA